MMTTTRGTTMTLTTRKMTHRAMAVLVGLGGALAIGCSGGPADDAESGASAFTSPPLPEAMCSLIAGVDTSGLSDAQPTMRVGGGYRGPDASVMQFQHDVGAIGGTGRYTILKGIGANSVSWYAIDVSHVAQGTVTGVVDQYPSPPVAAGFYRCTYLWGDYVLPHGAKRPYAPEYIVAYDPRGCSSCGQ